ncbi:hypothetical protein ACFSKL_21765 [Belliella marina]|uniref:Uncharacterized protein n=1 Tax=Belliella marina TaxID=1644146 RepID=A0ABW4VVS8_9BACT
MKNLSRKDIFKVPENYFESLPDKILEKNSSQKTKMFYFRSMAAAAIVIIGVAIFVFKQGAETTDYLQLSVAEDINLYINAGHWGAEEILYLADDPDKILDQIINEEWGNLNLASDEFEENLWY